MWLMNWEKKRFARFRETKKFSLFDLYLSSCDVIHHHLYNPIWRRYCSKYYPFAARRCIELRFGLSSRMNLPNKVRKTHFSLSPSLKRKTFPFRLLSFPPDSFWHLNSFLPFDSALCARNLFPTKFFLSSIEVNDIWLHFDCVERIQSNERKCRRYVPRASARLLLREL